MAARRTRLPATKGRKCTICTHKALARVNKALLEDQSFRNIAKLIVGDEKAYTSVFRHADNCLKLDIAAMRLQKRAESVVNVYDEFLEQLQFAKRLRIAAEDYLSDEIDPLRITLIPRADEIDVVYFDGKELNERGKPTKKTESLAMLLAMLEEGTAWTTDKVTIKHVDMRKFALDAIATTDACIDKFAKIEGIYQREKQNAMDQAILADSIVQRLVDEAGWTREAAIAKTYPDYGLPVSEAVN